MSTAVATGERRISPVFLTLVAVMAAAGFGVREGFGNTGVGVFLFVVAGWVVSLCLHEYAHARTALHSGDISVGAKGYLTLNPLRYTHAALSIVLPVVFVILGGIGLPGGAVFIERGRIRGRWKHSLVSLAGPLVNVLCAAALAAGFALGGPAELFPSPFRSALAFLLLLQVSAALLNLLPVPGLDGYGVLEPWLPWRVRREMDQFGSYGIFLVFALLWVPPVRDVFWQVVYAVMDGVGVPGRFSDVGHAWFTFWQGSPGL